jgi:predicted O-methyltransferase YrrM
MSEELWIGVDRYINGMLLPNDRALEAALQASAEAGLPPINVSPNQGKLLMLLTRLVGARAVLELGTLAGYSTIWLARGLAAGGRLITMEVDPQYAEVARNNIARADVNRLVEIRVGPALELLPSLHANGDGPFDLIFIDADKANYPGYFKWGLRLSRPGTLIIIDNVVRKGAVIVADSDDPNIQGIRRLYQLLATETRVSATAIQTVGGKGHDGFAFVLVNG